MSTTVKTDGDPAKAPVAKAAAFPPDDGTHKELAEYLDKKSVKVKVSPR